MKMVLLFILCIIGMLNGEKLITHKINSYEKRQFNLTKENNFSIFEFFIEEKDEVKDHISIPFSYDCINRSSEDSENARALFYLSDIDISENLSDYIDRDNDGIFGNYSLELPLKDYRANKELRIEIAGPAQYLFLIFEYLTKNPNDLINIDFFVFHGNYIPKINLVENDYKFFYYPGSYNHSLKFDISEDMICPFYLLTFNTYSTKEINFYINSTYIGQFGGHNNQVISHTFNHQNTTYEFIPTYFDQQGNFSYILFSCPYNGAFYQIKLNQENFYIETLEEFNYTFIATFEENLNENEIDNIYYFISPSSVSYINHLGMTSLETNYTNQKYEEIKQENNKVNSSLTLGKLHLFEIGKRNNEVAHIIQMNAKTKDEFNLNFVAKKRLQFIKRENILKASNTKLTLKEDEVRIFFIDEKELVEKNKKVEITSDNNCISLVRDNENMTNYYSISPSNVGKDKGVFSIILYSNYPNNNITISISSEKEKEKTKEKDNQSITLFIIIGVCVLIGLCIFAYILVRRKLAKERNNKSLENELNIDTSPICPNTEPNNNVAIDSNKNDVLLKNIN